MKPERRMPRIMPQARSLQYADTLQRTCLEFVAGRAGASENACSDRELACVPHRMFCSVDQAADHRRRKLSSPHSAEVTKCRNIDGAQLIDCSVDTPVDRLERLWYLGQ